MTNLESIPMSVSQRSSAPAAKVDRLDPQAASFSSGLPRRDVILLPLISLLTVLLIVGVGEVVARVALTEQLDDACLVPDARLGLRYIPNCTSQIKSFESPWVTNHYNACGYRTDASCGPVSKGVRRVAVLGSSVTMGYLVPQQDSFATQTAEALTERCGAPVEFQNLGGYLVFWTRVINRVDDALRLKPDAGLLQVTTLDIEHPDPGEGSVREGESGRPTNNFLLNLKNLLVQSRAWGVMQHFLFRNEELYTSLYLHSGSKADYLREPLSDFWEHQLHQYDIMVGKIADRFHAAGVPLALVFVPQRAQAELAAKGHERPNIYPYELNQHLQQIASRHGVAFIDTTKFASEAPSVSDLYYAVDGHLDGAGHRRIAPAIVDGMIADLPPFKSCGLRG